MLIAALRLPVTSLAIFLVPATLAADLSAKPGDGTISAVAAKAKPGDVIVLDTGEYHDEVRLPEGVTLRGTGHSVLIPTGYAAISTSGPNVTIVGVDVRGVPAPAARKEGAPPVGVRGVNSSLPVRVERCRFENVPEAVALMNAPLSDVVQCEFKNCNIAVRAIGGASPTVWGCLFRGGGMGVFAMDGSPYIRNNVFADVPAAIRIAPSPRFDVAIIRNNVFLRCSAAAVEVLPAGEALAAPSVRNNLVVDSGAIATGPVELLASVTNDAVTNVAQPIKPKQGADEKGAARSIAKVDAGVKLSDAGELTLAHPDVLAEIGLRLADQPKGAKGVVGLTAEVKHPGAVPAGDTPPPTRFLQSEPLVNGVAEEYAALAVMNLSSRQQSLVQRNGHPCDEFAVVRDGKPATQGFDISRFFGEMELEP